MPTGIDKFMIRNEYTSDVQTIEDLGMCNLPQQLETFQGKFNSNYQDTDLCYRLVLTVNFNPYLCSGKCITLKFSKQSKFGLLAMEFTGSWLIIESAVTVDCETSRAFTQITVAKPGINVDPLNPFIFEFFGI